MTSAKRLSRIVIAGGDLIGWTVAAALGDALRDTDCRITVLELPDVINVEPTQFTAPATLDYFRRIGVDEDELIRRTGATFRLGTGLHYRNDPTDHRILAFGSHGPAAGVVPFHHYAIRKALTDAGREISLISPNRIAAQNGRVIRPADEGAGALPPIEYGLNLNTEKLTRLLRDNARLNGVETIAASMDLVELEPSSGYIECLKLGDGSRLAGDLFIDCSGEPALLIGAAMGVAYEDWRDVLPCTRSMAVTTAEIRDNTPVHHLAAVDAGWISTTPLQQRAAHRLLYSPEHLADAEAETMLLAHLTGEEPEAIATTEIRSGRRREHWANNCIAIGAAAGSVEPLDFSALHLAQSAALELTTLLPATPASPALAREFNRRVGGRLESLRDLTRLNYHASAWRDAPFWQAAAANDHPESLQRKIDTFLSRGHIELEEHPVLPEPAWIAALLAAGCRPSGYHSLLDALDANRLDEHYARILQSVQAAVSQMPEHRSYLRRLVT